MTTKYNIREDPVFVDFCENRNIAPPTIKKYVTSLKKYTNLTGMTLGELLDEADLDEDRAVKPRNRRIKKHLLDFKKYLDSSDYSGPYKESVTLCVRTFYGENDIILPKTFRKSARSDRKTPILFNELPTMDNVKDILKYCNSTYRAIILLGVSSGMSRAELCSLTFKHFFDAIPLDPYPETLSDLIVRVGEKDNLVPIWSVRRVKTGNDFFTFSSPEASDALLEYFKDLNRRVIRYDKNKRTKSEFEFIPETSLFRNFYNRPIQTDSMSRTFQRLNYKAGFEKVNNKIFIRPHSLRQVFASTLEKNKMPHLMTRWLMGHALDHTTFAYFKADPVALKEEYLKVLNYLTTNAVEIKVINQYEDLSEKLDQKDKEYSKLQKQLQENKNESELREIEFRKMKQRMDAWEKLQLNKQFHKDISMD